jgi:hypothetical protein
MGDLILKINYGGLGDHLFYSPIPRIAKETGAYNKVFISNRSEFRCGELRRLIWESNPHVDGFVDEDGRCVDGFQRVGPDENILDRIMLALGLDDGRRRHEPELYHRPRTIVSLAGTTLYDPNYLSNAGAGFFRGRSAERYFAREGITIDHQMTVRGTRSAPVRRFGSFLSCGCLEDFIDVLFSVDKIYCLATGTATLAAALRKKAVVLYWDNMNPMFLHSSLNTYIPL